MPNKFVMFFEEITKWVDDGSPVDVIYLHFQKAFDKVPHQRLILKLKSHGMGNSIINWIEQWLTDRRRCRTLVRRPCNVSLVQYATPRCVARSVHLYYTRCHRRRSLPRHQLFIDCQGCPIHTSSVQLHIITHVVQLKFHSYNYNHDNVIRSVTHNSIPVIS